MTITDQEFTESCNNRENLYRDELNRDPIDPNRPDHAAEVTYMDRLGRGRWPVDYYAARLAGYTHADAMQVERVRIRQAAGLVPKEPMPIAPPPPVPVRPPPPDPAVDAPGVADDAVRFAAFYERRCQATGIFPDSKSDRDSRVKFLQGAVLLYADKTIVMKRADMGRPISDDVIVFVRDGPDYRRFFDFIGNCGIDTFKIGVANREGEILPAEQPLVDPVTLQVIRG